jgi:putative transposase
VRQAVEQLHPLIGISAACAALGTSRSMVYRARQLPPPSAPRPPPRRALSEQERTQVLAVLNSDPFADKAPAQIYAQLLDDKTFLCSIRTMYRILAAAKLVRERRRQLRHPTYTKPRLVARRPNDVWTWDITKVAGPSKGTYYSLYVILDLFSRCVVGWTVTLSESATLAQRMIEEAYDRHQIQPGQLTCHADRGSPMMAKSTAQLYADLGILKSHSRPRVSNDNAFSEAAFKTFLYRPDMPERFGSLEDARAYYEQLFDWYNERHYHSGLALLTPASVHRGACHQIIERRQAILDDAYAAHPERFADRPIQRSTVSEVWINRPTEATLVSPSSSSGPQPEASVASGEDRTARAESATLPIPPIRAEPHRGSA